MRHPHIKIYKPSQSELSQRLLKNIFFCVRNHTGKIQFFVGKFLYSRSYYNEEREKRDTDIQLVGESSFYLSDVLFWSDEIDVKPEISRFLNLLLGNDEHFKLFHELKCKFERINNSHDREFQKRECEPFFADHSVKIALLARCMGDSAFKWMSDQLAQTVLALERLLEGLPDFFSDDIIEFLFQFFQKNKNEIMASKKSLAVWKNIIVNLSIQFEYNKSLGGKSVCDKINFYQLNCIDLHSLSELLNLELLSLIYDTLNLSQESRSKIDTKKLFESIPCDLFAMLAKARKKMGAHRHAAILEELINCYLTGESINRFLHDPDQSSDIGKALAKHNEKIRALLMQKGIDPQNALHYDKTYEFSYEPIGMDKVIGRKKSLLKKCAHFKIEQWNKEKVESLFLGNEVDCCLAVNSDEFPAIIQRIMDDAMLFHVVIDLATQKPIALTWLYLAEIQGGDINLVANFIEIKAKYGTNEDARETIINALLHFSFEMYCRDNPEIKRFIINPPFYGLNVDKILFEERPVSLVDKVGGAFSPELSDEERAKGGRQLTCKKYYLESLGRRITEGAADFHIYDAQQLSFEKRERFMSIENKIIKIVNEHIVHASELYSEKSYAELISHIDPLVRAEINERMRIFFDGKPEKLSRLLNRAYKIFKPCVVSEAGMFAKQVIDQARLPKPSMMLEKTI